MTFTHYPLTQPEEERYVKCEFNDDMIVVALENGKIDLSVFMSNEIESPKMLPEALIAWVNDTSSVIIAPHFTVASPVDYLIDSHQLTSRPAFIDIDAKPIFEALKAEMLEQVARIDALLFSA